MKNNWIYKVFLLTFLLSIIFSTLTNLVAHNTSLIWMFWIIVGIIIFSIIFDMFSTSALTSSEASFHAMSSQGIKGAKQTINIIKNNAKFVTICSDVIGDVCGILSGGLGAVFAINLAQTTNFNLTATVVITTAFISAFTVGGKAIFKEVAIRNSDRIIFIMGKIKYYLRMK